MLILHRSNRVERLVDRLADWVRKPLASPFAAEVIGVPSRGMERWLTLQLARHFGVCANVVFPYPRPLLEQLYDAVLGPPEGPRSPDPLALTLSIAQAIDALKRTSALAPVRDYLHGDASQRKLLQLAQRVAQMFDRLVLQRPDMLCAWSAGADVYVHPSPGRILDPSAGEPLPVDLSWQAAVWREVERTAGGQLLPKRRVAFAEALRRGEVRGALPQRIAVFGAVALPVALLGALRALVDTGLSQVALFIPTPTRDYLGNVARADLDAPLDEGALHPLLVSMGKLLGGFQLVVEELGGCVEQDDFDETFAPTVLGGLQRDLLLGRGDEALPPEASVGRAAEPDSSLVLHDCQGPLREVEALHDALLGALDADATLEPRDLVVMCPRIDRFAPLIDAVFGGAEGPLRLPYHIADRSPRLAEPVHEAFFTALELLGGRFTAAELTDLLRLEPVAANLGLDAEAVEEVDEWFRTARFSMGVDRADREAQGAAPLHEHTLRYALDRLLVGLAMRAPTLGTWGGVAPVELARGVRAQVLERVVDLVELLAALRCEARTAAPIEVWGKRFTRLIDGLFDAERDDSAALVGLRDAVDALGRAARDVGFDRALDLRDVEALLAGELSEPRGAGPLLARGVTFCAMLPLRAIPFRVVALLGMSDGEFPRQDRPASFDLLATHTAPGDRSVRADDQHLFLEAILSARDRLIVTYSGRSPHDPSVRPPSVAVSALDEAQRRWGRPSWQRVAHALQPWSPEEFVVGDARHSYSPRRAVAATSLVAPRVEPPRFTEGPLVDATRSAGDGAGALPELTLDELVRALQDPTTYYVTHGLGLMPPRRGEDIELEIPMSVDRLTHSILGRRWLDAQLEHGEPAPETLGRWARAEGVLPPGEPGLVAARAVEGEARRLVDALAGVFGAVSPRREVLSLDLGVARLSGELSWLVDSRLVSVHVAEVSARHELGAWVRLLAAAVAGIATEVVVVGLCKSDKNAVAGAAADGGRRVAESRLSVAASGIDARATLRQLVELVLLARREPLPFFLSPAVAYAEALGKGKSLADSENAAAKKFGSWEDATGSGDWSSPSCQEPLVQRLYVGTAPLEAGFRLGPACTAPDFPTLVQTILVPLMRARGDS